MLQQFFTRLLWFLLLLLLQVLVFNHIHIMGYATPMPYFYFLIILPRSTARWVYVAMGFLLGITIDVFSSTLGAAAASLTLVGLLTPWLLEAFAPEDKLDEDFTPSVRSMQWNGFVKFATAAALIHIIVFFAIENFTFFRPLSLIFNIVGSTLLTLLIVAAIERIRLTQLKRPGEK